MIQHALRIRRHIATAVSVTFVSLAMAPAAHASGSSMPWEAPLQSILESIEGPVAKIIDDTIAEFAPALRTEAQGKAFRLALLRWLDE